MNVYPMNAGGNECLSQGDGKNRHICHNLSISVGVDISNKSSMQICTWSR